MGAFIFPGVLLLAAFLAACFAVLALIGSLQMTKNRSSGFLHLVPYGIIVTAALLIAYGGRDLSQMLMSSGAAKPGIVTWPQRLFTVLMLLASLERMVSHILKPQNRSINFALLWSFIAFWLGSTAMPVLFGQHSNFSHDIIYPLLMGAAALFANVKDSDRVVAATRTVIVLFTALSWLMVLVAPRLVLESNYSQGYLPGVPRFAGLAAHAVALGMIVQIGMFCLWARPYEKKYVNIAAWTVLLAALFLSQAKAAWLSFIICAFVMMQTRGGGELNAKLFNTRKPLVGATLITVTTLMVACLALFLLLTDSGPGASAFLSSKEGAQLTSLTGRDKIWAAALEEWLHYPIFGYGTELFSLEHRASLGLMSATHGHNQFIDTLARSGLVGAVPLVAYIALLGWYSFKYAKPTKGLSAALFIALSVRGISEIPFSMVGYSHEFLGHFVLLTLLAAAHREYRRAASRMADRAAPL